MAASARATVGSATWIAQERTQAADYLDQELDEFRYSAQNELEWLNENMNDIFSKNKLKFADVFKTPSKLRGKTPRTIRKTDQRSARAPLTDIFAPKNVVSPVKTLNFTQLSTSVSVPRAVTPEVEVEPEPIARETTPEPVARVSSAQRRVTSEASFVSAKDHDSDKENNVDMEDVQVYQSNDKENNVEMEDIQVYESNDNDNDKAKEDVVEMEDVQVHQTVDKENNVAMDDHESETSSPEQPLHRKSSFTFSSLPAREPLQKFKSTTVLPNLAAPTPSTEALRETILPPQSPVRESPLKKSISTPVLPKPVAPAEAEGSAHKNRLWSAIKSAKKIFASSAGTSAAAKLEAQSNDEELAAPPTITKPSLPPAGKLKAPGRLARPTKEAPQSKPAPAIIRVASQSQRLGQGQGHVSQPSFSSSTNGRSAPPSRDASSRAPPPLAGRVKALEAAAKKKEADERAVARKAEQKLEIERKRTEAKIQKEAEERKRAEAKAQKEAEERRRVEIKAQKEAEERKRVEAKMQRDAEAEERKRADARAQKEAEETRSRAAHDLAESIKRERAVQNQNPPPRSDVPGTLRQLTKGLKPALKRTMPTESAPAAEVKRRRTNEEQDEQMGGIGPSRPSVMAPPKRPSTMRKENIGKFSHGYSHAPPPAAHHASGMYKPANSTQMQHLQHKPMHPSHLVQMSSARIPFAASESSSQQHYAGSSSQNQQMRNPFAASESSTHQQQQQQHYTGYAQNQQMYKTPARPAAHMIPKSAPKSANTILGDNIELPDIMTDSEDEDEEEGGGFRVPSWAATPALKVQLEDQQLIDPETVFGPIGEMNMEEMFKNGKNTERLKAFRNRGSSALWVENRDQITSAEKRKDRELRAKMVRDGGWTYDPDAMKRP